MGGPTYSMCDLPCLQLCIYFLTTYFNFLLTHTNISKHTNTHKILYCS